MDIRHQNIIQISIFLLSLTQSMVERGLPMVTKNKQWYTFKVFRL